MFWLFLICFAVGVAIIMLFTEEGRGCLGGLVGLVFLVVAVTALGGGVLFGIFYLLSVL